MFPFDIEDLDDEETIEEITEQEHADYELDFSTGRLTGRIVRGIDAVVQWAKVALSIDRYTYQQYSWGYASDLVDLIGTGYSQEYYDVEVERRITETLTMNDAIVGIDDFECAVQDDKITASFTLKTIYGEVEMNV